MPTGQDLQGFILKFPNYDMILTVKTWDKEVIWKSQVTGCPCFSKKKNSTQSLTTKYQEMLAKKNAMLAE